LLKLCRRQNKLHNLLHAKFDQLGAEQFIRGHNQIEEVLQWFVGGELAEVTELGQGTWPHGGSNLVTVFLRVCVCWEIVVVGWQNAAPSGTKIVEEVSSVVDVCSQYVCSHSRDSSRVCSSERGYVEVDVKTPKKAKKAESLFRS